MIMFVLLENMANRPTIFCFGIIRTSMCRILGLNGP